MVARKNYFFTHLTARKLNVSEIFLLKRAAEIRLRETGKRVKHIFPLIKLFFDNNNNKKTLIIIDYNKKKIDIAYERQSCIQNDPFL